MTDPIPAKHEERAPAGRVSRPAASESIWAELKQLDTDHVMQTYAGRYDVAFVRGEGARLWDADGKEYLDFLAGIAVVSLGHAHPVVADAIAEQAKTLLHTSNFFLNPWQPRLAAKIDGLLGGGGRVFCANSGAEANECAIKLARRHGQTHGGPDRYHVLSTYGSFHGRTLTTLAATGQPQKQETFQPLPSGFRQVEYADLDALAAAMDERVCAVLIESVQGEGGVIPAPPGYLQAVRDLCNEREALLIMDEVQTGLGRTGRWFGFEHAGIDPDVVTLAKALGNGMPIGACWAREEAASALRPGDHATTFGGQALAARVAYTVLDIMEEIDAPGLAEKAGARLSSGLSLLAGVTSVRGWGLLLGAELEPELEAPAVVARCLERGLVVNAVTPTTIRFAPPLVISEAEIDEALTILGSVLQESA